MKNRIMKNWSLPRLLRLILGSAVVVQGINEGDLIIGLVGAAFSAMAIFNVGCCGSAGCAVPVNSKQVGASKDVSYEEVVK